MQKVVHTKGEFDINQLPTDGYFVLPLSMSRLHNSQSPEECYKIIEHFEKKVRAIGIDCVVLYTNGLYYNNTESALEVRKRTNNQMLHHKNALYKLIQKHKKYIPQAFHFLPWDYVILNTPEYQTYYELLVKRSKTDEAFYALLLEGLSGREENEANLNFLIEEIVVTHIIRQRLIEFPKTLVKQDNFRLVMYPGPFFKADLYQWKHKILPQTDTDHKKNPFYATHYDWTKKIISNFDDLEIQ